MEYYVVKVGYKIQPVLFSIHADHNGYKDEGYIWNKKKSRKPIIRMINTN